jgi:hypothetical protein
MQSANGCLLYKSFVKQSLFIFFFPLLIICIGAGGSGVQNDASKQAERFKDKANANLARTILAVDCGYFFTRTMLFPQEN